MSELPESSQPESSSPETKPTDVMPGAAQPRFVLHMAPADRWRVARDGAEGLYRDPSLDAEGFIHCSTAAQILIPANERFAGHTDLVLLVVDVDQVPSPTLFEDCYESGHAFPHIYGPIPTESVVNVVPFPCQADGTFVLPGEVADLA